LSQGYKFKGWYIGDELISTSESFYYTMPTEDIKLTAHIIYSPESPEDPNGTGQDNVETGISSTISTSPTEHQIYRLDGTRVSAITSSGTYIINHKKVIIRK